MAENDNGVQITYKGPIDHLDALMHPMLQQGQAAAGGLPAMPSAPPPAAPPMMGRPTLGMVPQNAAEAASASLPASSGVLGTSTLNVPPPPKSKLQKVGHILGTVGEIAGTAFVPRLMPWIPGTEQHKLMEQDVAQERQAQQAETGLKGAQSDYYESEAYKNLNPPSKAATPDEKWQAFQSLLDQGIQPIEAYRQVMQAGHTDTSPHFEPKMVVGPDGKPMAANYDPSRGQYFDQQGNLIPNARVIEKPPATTDIKQYTSDYLQAHGLQDTPENRLKAHKAFTDETKTDPGIARAQAYGTYRPMAVIMPDGTLGIQFAGSAVQQGSAPAGPGAQAMAKQAQFGEMHTAVDKARSAIKNLDKPFTADQIAKLTLAFSHDDAGVVENEINILLGTQKLTPAQEDFVVWARQLDERALSLRNVAGMGQGSDQMREAIRATLPGLRSGSKGMALKQLAGFENQLDQLEKGVPKVKGSRAGVGPTNETGGAQEPIIQRNKSTGAYRYSTDGGKTWQAGQPK